MDCGKVVVCDEAHKHFDGKAKDGLAGAVVDTVRLMRHEGIRVVISTQSPLTMPTELLELSTLAIFHSFHSSDWYKYLAAKLPLPEGGFDCVRRLQPGEALVFAARTDFDQQGFLNKDTFVMKIRPRLTEDRGVSRQNVMRTPSIAKQCWHCELAHAKPLRCSRCKRAMYCNAHCQKEDYPRHKIDCRQRPCTRKTSKIGNAQAPGNP